MVQEKTGGNGLEVNRQEKWMETVEELTGNRNEQDTQKQNMWNSDQQFHTDHDPRILRTR